MTIKRRVRGYSLWTAVAFVVAGFAGLALTSMATMRAQTPAAPTFAADVAPIMYAKCVSCHRPGEVAPMSLITFKDVRPWASAIKDKDPTYYATNMQFRCFTAWNIQRAMKLYDAGHLMTEFAWQTQEQYATTLRTSPAAEPLRAVARELWGAAWTQGALGF